MLPEVRDCDAVYGETGAVDPRRRRADPRRRRRPARSRRRTAYFAPGIVKATYGTAAFQCYNTGGVPVRVQDRLLDHGRLSLAGERAFRPRRPIFIAGAAVQSLATGSVSSPRGQGSRRLAADADPEQDVYLVPAFVGLGAPYWRPEARRVCSG